MTTQDLIQGFITDLDNLPCLEEDGETHIELVKYNDIRDLISKYQRLLEGGDNDNSL